MKRAAGALALLTFLVWAAGAQTLNAPSYQAIVLDSPWETQYNTWRFNPHQFPDPSGLIARLREAGVRTVVWVTPWVNLESDDGQRPPGIESERLHSRPET